MDDENELAICKDAEYLLKDLLMARVLELAEISLSKHQRQVFDLIYLKDSSYANAAFILDCNPTGVSHAILGIKQKNRNFYHGGLIKKMQKVCKLDNRCQILISELEKLVNASLIYPEALRILREYEYE